MTTILKKDYNRIFIVTDWHLNHDRIFSLEDRPSNYKELIFKNYLEIVNDDDLVINLGDVIFKRASELKSFLSVLPGKKVLCQGNHDKQKLNWYLRSGFDIADYEIKLDQILFSHIPRDISKFPGVKYNIHGHFHQDLRHEKDRNKIGYDFYSDNHLCLTIDKMNWKPILLKDFLNDEIKAKRT